MKTRSIIIALRILGVLLILYGALIIALPSILPYAIVLSPNFNKSIDPADDPSTTELQQMGVRLHLHVPVGPPYALLSCFVMEPSASISSRGTILLLHGHRDRKLTLLPVGHDLVDAGYRVILVDHRGHGLSSGDYLSYGVVESHDMMILLDTLQHRGLIADRIGVLGFSYGGSVGIQLAAKDKRVAAMVSVSTFSSLRSVVGDYLHCFLPFVAPFIPENRIDEGVRKGGEIAGFNPADADTEQKARTLHIPLLLMHGEDDWRIPIRHGERLARVAAGEHRFVRIPDHGHGDILQGESKVLIMRESLEWFSQYLK